MAKKDQERHDEQQRHQSAAGQRHTTTNVNINPNQGPNIQPDPAGDERRRKEEEKVRREQERDKKGGHGKEFGDKIKALIDENKNQFNKQAAVNALRTQADLLDRDTSWARDDGTDPADIDLDDPDANPLGARPAPAKATRADEATAPEPDSGAVQDRRAAQSGAEERGLEARKTAPPSDRDAVEAKEGAKAADESLSEDEKADLTTDPASTEGRTRGSGRAPR